MGRFIRVRAEALAGMKAWRREVTEAFALRSDGYSYEVELPIKALRRGFRVIEVPITTEPRRAGESSVRVVRTALRLGGGVQIPIVDWLQLSPYGTLELGQISDFTASEDCKNNKNAGLTSTPWDPAYDYGTDKRAGHFVVTLGVGGDLLFGGDKPRK